MMVRDMESQEILNEMDELMSGFVDDSIIYNEEDNPNDRKELDRYYELYDEAQRRDIL